MSARGRIAAFLPVDGVGRIVLDNGAELRFGASACVGFAPVEGMEVWVPETVPHPMGGLKAKSVHRDAQGRFDTLTLLSMRKDLDEQLAEELERVLGSETFQHQLQDRVPSVDETLAACGVPVRTGFLETHGEELLNLPYEPNRLVAWAPFDPCFVGFADADGDAFGFFVYPPAIEFGHAPPVVRFDHEEHRLTFVAATLDVFLAKKARSKPAKAWLAEQQLATRAASAASESASAATGRVYRDLLRGRAPDGFPLGLPEERADVAAMIDAMFTDEVVPIADRVAARMRALCWPALLVLRAEVQRDLLRAERIFEGAKRAIERRHWEAHRDVYADRLG